MLNHAHCITFQKIGWNTVPLPQIINAYILWPSNSFRNLFYHYTHMYESCSIAHNSKRLATIHRGLVKWIRYFWSKEYYGAIKNEITNLYTDMEHSPRHTVQWKKQSIEVCVCVHARMCTHYDFRGVMLRHLLIYRWKSSVKIQT